MKDSPSGTFAGMRVLVTGSSRGIGRAILRAFSEAGADVIAHADRSYEEARRLARELEEGARRAAALRADLADPQACRRLVDQAFEPFGGIDVWVNNAGADILTGTRRERSFQEKLEDLLAVDVKATAFLTREAGRRMLEAGGGAVVNVGWDRARTGMAGDSGELYALAKGAVMSFTKSAAASLAPRVRVNCVAPGWIRTGWGETASAAWQERVRRETPLERWGAPEDVAGAVVFLASDAARFITGQVICVGGGAVR